MASNTVVRESALLWLKQNTTLDITDGAELPANVELFIEKYNEIMELPAGISSESISGLSQSFNTSGVSTLLKQYAREIIGAEYMRSDVRAHPALDNWTY